MSDEKAPAKTDASPGESPAEGPAAEQKAADEAKATHLNRKFRWIARLFALLFCLGLAEVAARLGGHRPWEPDSGRLERFHVIPGPAMFSRDEEIGHALQPGMQMISYGYSTCLATHLDKYRRLTRPYDMPPPPADAKSLWFFGDSFTYGGSISDQEAYPYRVQVKHPELNVVNYAIPGQSSIQTLLLLKKLLASGEKPPNVAFMGYASFHDGRTLMARGNKKSWHPYRSRYPTFPAARLDGDKLITEWVPIDYHPLPFERYSGLMDLISVYYNKADVVLSRGKEVSQAVIAELAAFSREKGIHFVLLGVEGNSRTLDVLKWASQKGIQSADISVNLTIPENVVYGDGHPSGKATLQFAEKLDPVIKEALASPP